MRPTVQVAKSRPAARWAAGSVGSRPTHSASHRYDLCDLVTYRPSPRLEGFAALDRLDEALAPSRKSDVRALFRNQPMSEQTERLDRSDTGIALPQSFAEDLATLFVAIKEHILLARKVIEHCHPSDVGGCRDLVHGHMVEAPL